MKISPTYQTCTKPQGNGPKHLEFCRKIRKNLLIFRLMQGNLRPEYPGLPKRYGQQGMAAFVLEEEPRKMARKTQPPQPPHLPTGPLNGLGGKEYAQARNGQIAQKQLKNLGNVRVVVSDIKHSDASSGTPTDFMADVLVMRDEQARDTQLVRSLEMMETPLREDAVPGAVYQGDYRYGFNGMERDDEVKGAGMSYDFGARVYDPRVGRWWSLDRMSHLYRSSSAYCFGLDSPIFLLDCDGNEIYDSNGNKVEITESKEGVSYNENIATDTKELLDLLASSEDGIAALRWMRDSKSEIKVVYSNDVGFHMEGNKAVLDQAITFATDWTKIRDSDGKMVYAKQTIIVFGGSYDFAMKKKAMTELPESVTLLDEYNKLTTKSKKWILARLPRDNDVQGTEDTKAAYEKVFTTDEQETLQRMQKKYQEDKEAWKEGTINHEPTHAHPDNYNEENIEVGAYRKEIQWFNHKYPQKDNEGK
ncbi:MAG: RHS repeat-associated core domain-containing protein [Bacteroidia bacterium]